ncbi:pyruvate dehydrogenase complex dihydrolipoamide acetyltransferase [Nocardioides aestuarii]|uniref:Dihydrolipoamide acetyltransferase component of pyruvate dehydrogenase complex n=1 Tax=Nocardioides aestuarii TaxID=252231 RepID=A0ABW4TJ37_9ACTN
MARVLRMPGLSASDTTGVLAEWLVAEAATFADADALATIETDKALVDVEAEGGGVVLKTLVPPGSQVDVGAPIAVLADPGEEVADLDALLQELGVADTAVPVVAERRDVPDTDPGSGSPVPEPGPVTTPSVVEPAETNGRVFASPLARKMAREAGIPVEEITGTGPRHRVLRRDVEAAMASRTPASSSPAPAPASPPEPATSGSSYEDVPHTRLRRTVAERLAASKQQAPHFYVRATIRAERLLALRAELNAALAAEDAAPVSVNDLVVKAVAVAHARVPEMNVTWGEDAVRRWQVADVAVAVATDRGLVTPVVRDVGSRPVTAVAADVRELAGRAREGRLRQDDLEGGSITVSNLGMFGVEEFAAIINPPHAAILAVGAVRDEPVVEDGAVVPGRVMSLTLSVDHRPVDGVVAARWLAVLTEVLERPVRLLA